MGEGAEPAAGGDSGGDVRRGDGGGGGGIVTHGGEEAAARSLVLDPDLAQVAKARRLLSEVATRAGFSEARIFDITVACSEAIANAIEHAPVKGQVRVSTSLYEDRLEVKIEGPGEFQAPASLRERSSRGLGLPLMAKLSDHLMLHSGQDGGTLVGLTFFRPGFEGRVGHGAWSPGGMEASSGPKGPESGAQALRAPPVRMRRRLPGRRKAALVIVAGALLQVLIFWVLSLFDSPRFYLGIPGPAATLVGIGAALAAGPLAGVIVALVGGIAYVVLLTDFGEEVVWPAIIISIALWTLASVLAALVADRVREEAARRETVLSQAVSDRDELMVSLRSSEARQREAAEENARLYRTQQEIAETLQLAFLHIPSQIGRVRLGHLYRSATESALVGGDFYDVFEVRDSKIVVLIGDVAGHGIRAARTATLVKDVVHAFAHDQREPAEVLQSTNRLLVEKDLKGFVSLFLGVLDSDTGRFRFASAGHPMTFLRRRSGEVEAVGGPAPPMGVFPDASWRQGEIDLQADDVLLLYTDGLIEARRGDEFFGESGLRALLARRETAVEELPEVILAEVLSFSGGSLRDDIAILAVSLGSEQQAVAPSSS